MRRSTQEHADSSDHARLLRCALAATGPRGDEPDQVERLLSVLFARSVRAAALASCLAPLLACGDEEGGTPTQTGLGESRSAPDAAMTPGLPRYDAGRETRIEPDAGTDPDPFQPIPCVDRMPDLRIAQFTLSTPVDFVRLGLNWSVSGMTTPERPGVWTTTEAQRGEPCQTAMDRDTCLKAFYQTALAFGPEPVGPCQEACTQRRYVLTTQGDTVRGFGPGEVPGLLAPVDSAAEAWYVASFIDNAPRLICAPTNAGERAPGEREVADGFEIRAVVGTRHCDPIETSEVTFHIGRDGTAREVSRTTISSKPGCIVAGRRPAGLVATLEPSARDALGRVFARMAYLEAASVDAFAQLEEELTALDAPEALVTAAREARLDEVDHAARMNALAQRFGGQPRKVVVAPRTLRSAFELALDNAIEGCVRETFGALLATHQAEHASDEEIRKTMRIVARDETRHAALSWRVAAFMQTKLSAQQAEQVARAQQLALHELVDEIEEPCRRERELLGTPSRQQARLLLGSLWPLVAGQQSAA